ncbi:MAG TPA: selenite/tellurite reduction operon porin ExtI [Geobacterales bacterium]|nr:selenite/tellurite reduction operon porin ExtI [Geobacterales bacterium]
MKTLSIAALFAALLMTATSALAGPQIKFGEDDKGVMQIDYKGQFQFVARDIGSGPAGDDPTMQFNFRRNRLALMGKYGDVMSVYVQTEFMEDQQIGLFSVSENRSQSEFSMIDAVARFHLSDTFKIFAGKFKYNFSRENLEGCETPLTLDRSLFIRPPYVATRDKGVAIWGNIMDGLFQYRLDAMNGRGATTAAEPQPSSQLRYSARAHISVLDPEKDYGYKGTYLGTKRVLTVGGAVQYEPEMLYADTVNLKDPKDYLGWTADIFFEYPIIDVGTITLSGAYLKVDLDEAYKGFAPDSLATGVNGEKNGFYGKAAYLLPNLPLQFFGRYETWKFAQLQGIYDQELKWYGGGFNYYFRDQNVKLTMEASHDDFDKEDALNKDFTTVITQLQVIF